MEEDRELLEGQIKQLNEQLSTLAYRLGGLLDIDCNMGVCAYNPEVDDLQEKMKEVQKKKELLERLSSNLDSCAP